MNKIHLICAAVLDTTKAGGLQEERAEAFFNVLSPYISNVPEETVKLFVENVRRILDAELSVEEAL
jgi:hypothetical protein